MAQFKKPEEYKDEPMKVLFKVDTCDGEIPLPQTGTQEELQAAMVSINKDGLTLPNQRGFVWYPVTSIRKVTVEI